MIDSATVQKIKDAADIVEVVGDYVRLTRRGSNYMGLCPFHNERTPSFSVNRARNFCYCFSCHKGGSPVNFIMEKEGISYHDALLQLARKYGIKVEERELTDEERERQGKRDAMLAANEWAMNWMQHCLRQTDEGRDIGLSYLYGRGVTEQAVREFRLGYCPDTGHALADEARRAGYDEEVLCEIGLLGKGQRDGTYYDKFRGRVIFPILNVGGKVIGFGGRDLKGGPAKYINSPESPVYKKSNELYGLYQAKSDISRQGRCFLVEGYLDVIGMWQSGMKNVVASSGTALTDGQIALMHRFCENVTILYDGDPAGIKASMRGIDMLLSHKLNVGVLLLPDNDDPDSFARKHTPQEFQQFVHDNETDVIRFKAQIVMKGAGNDPRLRSEAISTVAETIASIPEEAKRFVYMQDCSSLLKVPEEILMREIKRHHNAKLIQWRKEREHKRINQQEQQQQLQESISGAPGNAEAASSIKQNPFAPLERNVIRYCAAYGMLPFCEEIAENGDSYWLSVIEYVKAEMDADGMRFSVPAYEKIFHEIVDMRASYEEARIATEQKEREETERLRKEGFDKIASEAGDMHQIERREKELEQELALREQKATSDFAASFISNVLTSHIDDDIRRVATDLLANRHTLSRYHTQLQHIETEEERLMDLLPRSILEWKNAILEQMIDDLQQKISSPDTARESLPELLRQLQEYLQVRQEISTQIGERVIGPKQSFSSHLP